MSAVKAQDATTRVEPGSDQEIFHLLCCDPDVGLCGTDVSQHEFRRRLDSDQMCVMCDEVNRSELSAGDHAYTCAHYSP